jgi:hypothetical protein
VLQIVTATLGIVFCPAFRTEITRWVCCASRWNPGNEAVVTWTGNLPLGSAVLCPVLLVLLPQPATAKAAARTRAATPTMRARLVAIPRTIADLLATPLLMGG